MTEAELDKLVDLERFKWWFKEQRVYDYKMDLYDEQGEILSGECIIETADGIDLYCLRYSATVSVCDVELETFEHEGGGTGRRRAVYTEGCELSLGEKVSAFLEEYLEDREINLSRGTKKAIHKAFPYWAGKPKTTSEGDRT